jgi:hypothetical protein
MDTAPKSGKTPSPRPFHRAMDDNLHYSRSFPPFTSCRTITPGKTIDFKQWAFSTVVAGHFSMEQCCFR